MKKAFLLSQLTLLLCLSTTVIFGSTYISNSSTVSTSETTLTDNEAEIYSAFTDIDDLTEYISENENSTYSDVEASNSELLTLVSSNAAIAYPSEDNRFSFTKQTAYFMGCAFGLPGILAVAIVNNGDTSVVNSSIWGFVTSGCVTALGVIAFYVFYFAAYSGGYY